MTRKMKIIALTGAGVSAESGLKTFRDSDGLWEGHDVYSVATPEGFEANPRLVIDFYNERRRQAQNAAPNAAHLALARLQQAADVWVVTQNIDDLHERAGSRKVLHLHGQLNKLRSVDDESYVIDWSGDQPYDLKDPAGHPMRPFVVWFGEPVPNIAAAFDLMRDADAAIVVGTSMVVQPAASLIYAAPSNCEVHCVDPRALDLSLPQGAGAKTELIAAPATQGVPQVVDKLIERLSRL